MFVLAIPAGHLAHRLPWRLVLAAALLAGAAAGTGLAVLSEAPPSSVLPYLALAAGAGSVMAIGTPAARAMPAVLVPPHLIPGAMTLRSVATQAAMVLGPRSAACSTVSRRWLSTCSPRSCACSPRPNTSRPRASAEPPRRAPPLPPETVTIVVFVPAQKCRNERMYRLSVMPGHVRTFGTDCPVR